LPKVLFLGGLAKNCLKWIDFWKKAVKQKLRLSAAAAAEVVVNNTDRCMLQTYSTIAMIP